MGAGKGKAGVSVGQSAKQQVGTIKIGDTVEYVGVFGDADGSSDFESHYVGEVIEITGDDVLIKPSEHYVDGVPLHVPDPGELIEVDFKEFSHVPKNVLRPDFDDKEIIRGFEKLAKNYDWPQDFERAVVNLNSRRQLGKDPIAQIGRRALFGRHTPFDEVIAMAKKEPNAKKWIKHLGVDPQAKYLTMYRAPEAVKIGDELAFRSTHWKNSVEVLVDPRDVVEVEREGGVLSPVWHYSPHGLREAVGSLDALHARVQERKHGTSFGRGRLPQSSDWLAKEAKKHKTAEEFANAFYKGEMGKIEKPLSEVGVGEYVELNDAYHPSHHSYRSPTASSSQILDYPIKRGKIIAKDTDVATIEWYDNYDGKMRETEVPFRRKYYAKTRWPRASQDAGIFYGKTCQEVKNFWHRVIGK